METGMDAKEVEGWDDVDSDSESNLMSNVRIRLSNTQSIYSNVSQV